MPVDRLAATLAYDAPVTQVKLVSPTRASALSSLGIRTIRDLLDSFPRRYLDLSSIESIQSSRIGQMCTICANVHEVVLKRPKPRLSLVEITLVDSSGTLIVTCFRQPWLANQIQSGMRLAIAGEVLFNYGFKRMTNPFIEILETQDALDGKIVPIHPACEKISPALMRRIVANGLMGIDGMLDPLPVSLRTKYRLMDKASALRCVHFPVSMKESDQAKRRLVYEELLYLELMLMLQSKERSKGLPAHAHCVDGEKLRAFSDALPFTLTEDQSAALKTMLAKLAACEVANHLILGDVGTGKTVLAGFAICAVADSGSQSVMLAPTEVLATQHAQKLGPLFDTCGVTWELLTGSTPKDERAAIITKLKAGTLDCLIGTHALLEPDIVFQNCTLAIIDEQQRFGVDQRATLLSKGVATDALFLTATPIPRSLALALYGDLSLSYLHQKPGRQTKRTTTVLTYNEKAKAYTAIRDALSRGEQAFVVCPLIGTASDPETNKDSDGGFLADTYEYDSITIQDESDFDGGNLTAAEQEAQFLQSKVLLDARVGLLHGRLSAAEKASIMADFVSGEINVLVSTTVIEVGIDVPNATVMVIQDAERFGLSQLHQLRGRVGRGDKPGEVFLVSSSKSEAAMKRLSAMETTEDGYELATYDLSIRREGDILGNRQHGATFLKAVNLVRDAAIVEAARDDAEAILAADPDLSSDEYRSLSRELRSVFKNGVVGYGG